MNIFRLTIDLRNTAFREDEEGNPSLNGVELGKVLRFLAAQVDNGKGLVVGDGEIVRDHNSSFCGAWEVMAV